MHWNGRTYLYGTEISDVALSNLEYRNARFERVDAAGVRLIGAQLHAPRPT